MKKITLLLCLLAGFGLMASAQIENPVMWKYSVKKVSDKTYDVYMTANIGPGWHLYAQNAGDGPVATTFNFTRNPLLTTTGTTKEKGSLIKEFDANFNSVLKFYANKVDFVQRITLKSKAATVFNGNVEYMVCNDHKCLPPKKFPFSIKVGGS